MRAEFLPVLSHALVGQVHLSQVWPQYAPAVGLARRFVDAMTDMGGVVSRPPVLITMYFIVVKRMKIIPIESGLFF